MGGWGWLIAALLIELGPIVGGPMPATNAPHPHPHAQPPVDLDAPLAVVVVGADPAAEVYDRPIARYLVERINAWAGAHAAQTGRPVPGAYCITDLWYLNNAHLRMRPTVAVGAPAVNAMSAMIVGRVPPVFAVADRYAVHVQPEFEQLVACCWGIDPAETHAAAAYFAERTMAEFLRSAVGMG
jgi:hypothetical protein